MNSKWLLGAAIAVLGSGYFAGAQDPPASGQQPPPPPARDNSNPPPPPANDNTNSPPATTESRRTDVQVDRQGLQVEGQVQTGRAAPARPMSFHRAKQIMGTRVSIEGGLAIGTVDDIVFADDGMIEYLVVNNEQKLVSVPWAAAKFNFEQRQAVVGITQQQFQQVPTYTAENFPQFNEQYRTQTYRYYNVPVPQGRVGVGVNVTPRQERRMERGRRP